MRHFWIAHLLSFKNSKAYASLNSKIEDKIRKPVRCQRATAYQQKMLTAASFFLDNTLDLSVTYHHECDCNTKTWNYSDTCINVCLPLQAEWKLPFKEIKFEVWIVCLVSNNSLKGIICIGQCCCRLRGICKYSYWVKLILCVYVLKE